MGGKEAWEEWQRLLDADPEYSGWSDGLSAELNFNDDEGIFRQQSRDDAKWLLDLEDGEIQGNGLRGISRERGA